MSEQPGRPRALDFPLRHARRIAVGLRGRFTDPAQLADRDKFTSHMEPYQEIRRHLAAALFVVLLVAIGASLLIAL
jgi:hypothetical protein